ncbi:MAG TPA: PAS domain S-box protein [Planctomycetota bacterium]|nr:PAS domain S-box protein [Planctomycetota bacterium]
MPENSRQELTTNERLEQSEERYRAFIAHSTEGIWRFELDQPISTALPPEEQIRQCYQYAYLAECNDATARMYGYTRAQELIGARLGDMMPENDPRNQAYLHAFIASNYNLSDAESHEIDKDGNSKYFLNNLQAVIENGMIVRAWGVQRDITDRKRYEQALRESEQRLQSILDNTTAVIHLKDASGRYLMVNKQWERVMNKSREDVVGKTLFDIFPASAAAALAANDRAVIEANRAIEFEETTPRADGNHTYISNKFPLHDATGRPHAVCGISTDITERKKIERDIQENRARLEAILSSALDAIVTMDHRGKVVEWNAAAERTFGYTASEVIGQDMAALIIPEKYRAAHRAGLQRFLETGAGAIIGRRLELTAQRKGGGLFLAELTVSRVSHSGPPLFTGFVRDISERKKIEDERDQLLARERELREMAEAANRAKDDFLGVISHELRTPLTPILGWSRMALSGKLDAASLQRGLNVIERNAKIQAQLIDDLLDISRIVSGKMRLALKPTAVRSFIQSAIETVRPSADARGIALIPPNAPELVVNADHDRMQQVLWNLLSNAVKFTPAGGTVQVSVIPLDTTVQIVVTDDGEGIAPEFISRLFNRFSQYDSSSTRSHGGLGLGLAIVRHIIELHGGTVEAASAGPGKGSTFTITLPQAAPKEKPGGSSSRNKVPPLSPLSLKGVSIVVTDDEPDSRELIHMALLQAGASITSTASAQEALDAVERLKPDLLISDLGMPEVDGYSLIRTLRERERQNGRMTPAIALTAYARAEDRARALSEGYQLHVPKPVDPDELAVSIGSLLQRFAAK